MGGGTMRDIFSDSPEITASLRNIIVQPMSAADTIRKWFAEHGWYIHEEELIYEDGQYYQMIACGRTENAEEDIDKKDLKDNEDIKDNKDINGNQDIKYIKDIEDLINKDDLAYFYGPLLIRHRHPLLKTLIEKDMAALQEIIKMLAKSQSEEAQSRYALFTKRYHSLRELKEWL
jgi:tRNA A22 N-methylase